MVLNIIAQSPAAALSLCRFAWPFQGQSPSRSGQKHLMPVQLQFVRDTIRYELRKVGTSREEFPKRTPSLCGCQMQGWFRAALVPVESEPL
jgi:hypothetical protein